MAYAEYPHAHMLEYDEHQILLLVMKLESEYKEILDNTRKAAEDAQDAVNKVNSYTSKVDEIVSTTVTAQVASATQQLKNDFTNLNNRFNTLQGDFNSLKATVTNDVKANRDYITSEVGDLRHYVTEQVTNSQGYINQLINALKADVEATVRESNNYLNKLANRIESANNKMFTDHKIEFEEYKKELDRRDKEHQEAFEQYKKDIEERNADIRREVRDTVASLKNWVKERIENLDQLTITRMRELSEQIVLGMNTAEENAKVYAAIEAQKNLSMMERHVEDYVGNILKTVEEIKNSQIYNNVGWLWNNMCSIGGFSAIEIFEYGEFNVDMWNASGITCKEWFTSGKQLLGYNTGRMFDTLSGRFMEVGNVVHELVNLLNAQGIIKNGFGALSIKRRRRRWNDKLHNA